MMYKFSQQYKEYIWLYIKPGFYYTINKQYNM